MLNLGIVYNKNGEVINHRSILKVFLNPFLQILGFRFVTHCSIITNELGRVSIRRCERVIDFNFSYKLTDDLKLVKERRII